MTAEHLHNLRTDARRAVDDGRFEDAMRLFVEAADLADAMQLPTESETLRTRARQVVVLVWARSRSIDVTFDEVRPVRSASVTRRFEIRAGGVDLVAIIDAADRVRIAPRRRG